MLADHPNLNMALRVEARPNQVRSPNPMPNRIVDGSHRIKPEWMAFIRKYADRLMIGADDFISPSDGDWRGSQSFDETWSLLNQMPPDVARKLGRENAERIYKLGG